ncbi:MAG: xanthine dehydrogenase accessory protein XdhC [Rickettsiales bacterium]|nr:xanthine dehydrogenase accessory protein XdhC [Rickettsiales bacterium]
MIEIYKKLLEALNQGTSAALCTVTQSAGSSPQKAGSKMLVYSDGSIAGTIGGGAIEMASIEQAREAILEGRTRLFQAHLSRDLAMCCGGRMEILIEPVGTRPKLVIFGGGHVGRALCEVAHQANFEVHVVDEREEHCTTDAHPSATQLHCGDPLDLLGQLPFGPNTYCVIVTHSHRLDEELLYRCGEQELRYLGMIGSRAKVQRFLARYRKRGMDMSRFIGVHAPIGLDLAAVEPGEIAVSIVAELIAIRRGVAASDHASLSLCPAAADNAIEDTNQG